LLALVQQLDGIVRTIITKVSGGTQAIQEELSKELENRPKIQGANLEVSLSPQTGEVLAGAERTLRRQVTHLVLGLSRKKL
jgi:ribosomal protein L18